MSRLRNTVNINLPLFAARIVVGHESDAEIYFAGHFHAALVNEDTHLKIENKFYFIYTVHYLTFENEASLKGQCHEIVVEMIPWTSSLCLN
jgi:hypothetical protein